MKHLESDLWIGVDNDCYRKQMERHVPARVKEFRQRLDDWMDREPEYGFSILPFQLPKEAHAEVREMAASAAHAGIGPMAAVAGLFAREAGKVLLQNFSAKELVIENGGDIFALVKENLVLTVFEGKSPLSENTGTVIPSGRRAIGICTFLGTVGSSVSFGKADSVAVSCRDVLLADALATTTGNRIKQPDNIKKAIGYLKNVS